MSTARSIKLIKNAERKKGPEIAFELVVDPNRWSTEVRSWIVEFQVRDRRESLPAFDSLFKDSSATSSSQTEN